MIWRQLRLRTMATQETQDKKRNRKTNWTPSFGPPIQNSHKNTPEQLLHSWLLQGSQKCCLEEQ
ncbi:hypothetical protein E2C01_096464 [Portunus trituberculatus]|uniref:Uncharacterized protein n=1 Tax=Portunus trituberculatus TaxID=210409 RepID=A0A5B7K319_PORTR|nr:hypothetical protein [Portunus trituberculatus]